jgi:MFS family permease
MFCLIFLVSGILTSFFYGTLLDKYQMYRKLLIITSFVSGVAFLSIALILPYGKMLPSMFGLFLVGAGIVPIMCIGYAFSVELCYPMPEAIVNGTMISIALIWGTI